MTTMRRHTLYILLTLAALLTGAAASALAVSRLGAQPSIPTASEVDALLKEACA